MPPSRGSLRAHEPGQEPQFIAIARVLRPQGRRGEVCTEILTDFPDRFLKLRRAYLESVPLRELAVDSAWPHKGRMVLKFAGVDSISEAERLCGHCIVIPSEERVPLADHSYYWFELCGCTVVTGSPGTWTEIGAVMSVEPTHGASLLHVVRKDSRTEILIPLAREICTQIDIRSKTIIVDPPEDLLTLNG